MMTDKDWYIIDNIAELDTPALVVYPERIKKNINTLKSMIDDVDRLRPHVKTYKNREVTTWLMEAGITKFKCATIAEAEMLGICQAPDVLLAYQPVGPKLKRFISLTAAYPLTTYSCLVDNIAAATEISSIAEQNNIQVPVFIDLNIGMNRTGIAPDDSALRLYEDILQLPGISVVGLHAYDGHIHDTDLAVRTEKANKSFELVCKFKDMLAQNGYPEPVIVAGGSPTFPIHAKREQIECSPGTFVYWDYGYLTSSAEQEFLTAAIVVSRVISLPDASKICLDLGHKSIASEKELDKRVFFLNAPELVFTGQSEEHLVAEAGAGHKYKVGDVLYGLPYHICPTVALYERAIIIEDGNVTGEWKNIARDRKITI